ncbi:hypothetical protein MEX01_24000 [Methylorubrum extorquens]|jgi:hypothetical protein|uniref:hypothetical protein n=1 Tax=Methylorubrum extorquens TaxID=408 RepID=UPI00116EB7F8|nr:hypothetical protein [Methylorubrum extorquens]GEL41809.1 hypothetical protein MEX01_24000 [Methylorubrum extorquens]
MPRWNRRPRPDYSHLYGRPLDVILDGAIANRAYGRDRRTFPAEANEALLDMYGERDRLAVGEMMDAHAQLVVRTGRGADWSDPFRADVVGNLIGWGLHLGILAEAPGADGERGWRLVEREPLYDVCNGRARQIRGLPADEQIAMNRRRATAARREATLARQRAETLAPRIATDLSAILEADPEALIPAPWRCWLDADIPARWPSVREAFGLLVEAHRGWPRNRQDGWAGAVAREVGHALDRSYARQEAEAAAAAAAARLAEDAEAFEGL